MNKLLNQLIQLQDLNFTLAEQKALLEDTCLIELEDSIKALSKNLPRSILQLFETLHTRYATAVVPVTGGICSGCGVTLPTSLAYEVHATREIMQCPRCTRIIYSGEGSSRQLKRIARPSEKPSAGIVRFSSSQLMIPGLEAKSREESLSELIGIMASEGFIEKPESLLSAALNREAIVPTAVDHGLAFPHVRGVEGGGLIFSAGMKKQGIKFGAPKDRLTRIIFFIVIPFAASAFYLQLIAGLMETFRETEARDKLLDCAAPEEMWKVLTTLTRKTIK
jgi:mannitol/fructose-specific phosphotransferase system IIA component (Ntr-type)